ncbi:MULTISPECIES: CinA family protein [Sphingobacterium]|uniref:CinA family protein n=1 Tax=Sphingobacterium tenebrionis TaxID=3111775 RepID=A0ABU8I3E2_9SPHI|nr:CinA family protein [Sphingobacterium sp. 1.A.4]
MFKIDHGKLNTIAEELQARKLKLALTESMTGGFMSSVWSLQTEAGDYLMGNLVCFNIAVKVDVLGVPQELIDQFTAESMEVTEAMLVGLKKLFKADVYCAITGLAYQGKEKHPTAEPGDVFLAVSFENKLLQRKLKFHARNAGDIYIQSFNAGMEMIGELLGLNSDPTTCNRDSGS